MAQNELRKWQTCHLISSQNVHQSEFILFYFFAALCMSLIDRVSTTNASLGVASNFELEFSSVGFTYKKNPSSVAVW